MSRIVILGSGGHAKVAADIALEMGHYVLGFLDDNADRHGQQILGLPILGPIFRWDSLEVDGVALGIGSNEARERLMTDLVGLPWQTLIHPRATVSRFARIGAGSLVAFGACIGPDTQIGRGAIVNTCASVDHDCIVGDFAHVAVGVTLAGTVRVGVGAMIGAGSCCRPGISIGDWAVVGAGAAIVRDIPAGVTAVGVPARWPEEPYGIS